MSRKWSMVPLGEVLQHRKEFVTIDDLTTYRRPRVQLHAQGVVLRDELPGSLIKTKTQQVCRAGEFLVAEIDAKVGGYGIVPDNLDGAIVSSHYFLFSIDESRLDGRFLEYFSRTAAFGDQVTAQGSTNYAAIRPAHVLSYQIPLPPLEEQRRIVGMLERTAACVADARGLRDSTALSADSLWVNCAERIFSSLASSCPTVPLAQAVSICGGGTPSKSNPFYWNGTIPWVTPKDMKVRELHDSIHHVTRRATEESPAKIIEAGAVLVVVRGMILAHTVPSAVLRVSAAFNQDIKALVPSSLVLPNYLCAALWAYNPRVLELVARSTHDTRKLQTEKLMAFEIPVPPTAMQRTVLSALDVLQATIDRLRALHARSTEDLDAILPALLDRTLGAALGTQ